MNHLHSIPSPASLREVGHTVGHTVGRAMRRLLLLAGPVLLSGLTGCNLAGFGQSKAQRALEEQLAALLALQQQIEQRLGLWQAISAVLVLIVLAGVALVIGAALGSRARRLRDHHLRADNETWTETATHPAIR